MTASALEALKKKYGTHPQFLKNEFGETPLDWVKVDSHTDAVRILSDHKHPR